MFLFSFRSIYAIAIPVNPYPGVKLMHATGTKSIESAAHARPEFPILFLSENIALILNAENF